MGRAIGQEYWNVETKLQFMRVHGIDRSIISLANPWLDFLVGQEAESVAQELNDELQGICESSKGKLLGFATLPVRNPKAAIKEIARLKSLSHIKGVILGTPGMGQGLDHENMRDILGAIADNNLTIFMHPHYGVGNEHYGDSGHALFLALGFPFETTVSVARLIVSGTLDKVPKLKLLVAHAGAALPSLIGRLDSCVYHDTAIANRLKHAPSDYFKQMYFDAISYTPEALECLIGLVGEDRIVFGTDNPFFPPPNVPSADLNEYTKPWPSTDKVHTTLNSLKSPTAKSKITHENAARIFGL
jgi:aminocarboxymuconate-semialdehyde decarboxylase